MGASRPPKTSRRGKASFLQWRTPLRLNRPHRLHCRPCTPIYTSVWLLALDCPVDAPHENKRRGEADSAEHDECCVRGEEHVPKEEARLQEAEHARAPKEVEKAVGVDEEAGAAAREHRAPPPTMVLNGELEIGKGDGDEGGDDYEHDEGDEQDAIQGIELMAPHRREDIMQLNVDGREGQEAGHEYLARALTVPDHLRDFSRDLLGPTRGAKVLALGGVAAENAADDV
mmetsp:Transcript_712/g.2136  ORF Transcript_712/g.2136 Transcript_712/m.2136 type:complete len:229 (+) Transcript_712:183-869(+)|eukprot:scaffold454_cov124-Isochrysis_galbana.AAC.6